MTEPGMTQSSRVVLALGSNLGDRLANLQAAVDALGAGSGLDEVMVSPVYQTAPVGGPPQPDYLNAVLVAATSLPPRAVLDRGRAAEAVARCQSLPTNSSGSSSPRSDLMA